MSEVTVEPKDITVVCCVEAGPLELMTVRMVESLRRFGGRFSRMDVFAVRPSIAVRWGPFGNWTSNTCDFQPGTPTSGTIS